jgi:DNA replication protein DnaC
MIREQTKEKLAAMKLRGMLSALEQWEKQASAQDLSPSDFLGLLVDTEWTDRENRRYTQLRRQARFPMAAAVEEIDYQHARGLKKSKMIELVSCQWIAHHQNLILTGATGVGKTYLACALGERACREGYKVRYLRAPRLFGDLYQAKADGSYRRVLERLAKTHLLILDDLGCAALEGGERQDLREMLEDRYSVSSTIVTSQFDPKDWHTFIGDETLADAICDRLVHNAHRLKLHGESMRKKKGLKTKPA